jgi:hypothetical protein
MPGRIRNIRQHLKRTERISHQNPSRERKRRGNNIPSGRGVIRENTIDANTWGG